MRVKAFEVFVSRTTLAGFFHSVQRSGLRAKIWFFLGVLGSVLTAFQVSGVIMEFFNYPVFTKVGF